MAEALTHKGATVTGIDPAAQAIAAAKSRAQQMGKRSRMMWVWAKPCLTLTGTLTPCMCRCLGACRRFAGKSFLRSPAF